jgi:hypothetical protein
MKTYKIEHKQYEAKVRSYENALCNWAGFLTSLSLVVYFLLMKAVGLNQVLEFRYVNVVFLITGILGTYYNYRRKVDTEGIEYLTGLKMGLRITLTAIIPFALFMAIYLRIDTDFMHYIREYAPFGRYLTPINAAGVVGVEGFISGGITSFMAMQYFKDK